MEHLPLLSREFLEKLDHLTLAAMRFHRRGQQENPSIYHKGSSLEFREYRPYQPGDDVRFVDWNVWERMEKLVTKVFSAEEERPLYLLVDTSGSMGEGNPTKLRFAAETAAAMAYIAGRNQNRTGLFSLGEEVKACRRPAKGSGALQNGFHFLESLIPGGRTELSAACRHFLSATDRSGIAVLLTDLLDPRDYREGIRHLLYRRFEVVLIHLLSQEDLNPSFSGPVLLTEREGGGSVRLTMDEPTLTAYRKNLTGFFEETEEFCRTMGVEYHRTSTALPFEDFILSILSRGVHFR